MMASQTFSNLIEIKEGDVINLEDFDFVFPIYIIGILSLYSDSKVKIVFDDDYSKDCIAYLRICKFFEHYIKLNDNTYSLIDEVKDNTTYSPIIAITNTLKIAINNLIVTKLCKSLLIKDPEPKYYFERIITEIIDNSIHHSHANLEFGSYYMMQYYYYQRKVAFVLVDNGIGIKQSFINNNIYYKNDFEYIQKAFELGVTSNNRIGAGNGLGSIRKIVLATNSELYFRSGNILYKIYHGRESIEITDNKRQGVALELQLNISIINKEIIKSFGIEYFNNLKYEDYDIELDDLF